MFYSIYLIFLPIIFTYDCKEICNITFSLKENTSIENLQWNLMELLANRTTISYQDYQYSLSSDSIYFELQSNILKYRLKEFDREKLCPNNNQCLLEIQIFTQTSFIILFQLIVLDENDCKPFFNPNSIHLILQENLSINHRIQLPIAYDYDSNLYNIHSYEFMNNTNGIERIFQLEKSSNDELKLKLLKNLDCELRNNYQLFIIATDKGGLKSNIL